jgi:DNA-binding MarR family transcriptional regulator
MKVKEENKNKFIAALQHLVRAIKSETEKCSEVCGGVSEKELTVVGFVGQNRNVKMSDIADNIESPMSTLTNIVDKLVEKGFLEREHSSEDRRAINVTLSAKGKASYKSLITQKHLIAEDLLSQYSEKEQAEFLKHVNLLASYLGKK